MKPPGAGLPTPPRQQPCSWEGPAPLASVPDTLDVGDTILPGRVSGGEWEGRAFTGKGRVNQTLGEGTRKGQGSRGSWQALGDQNEAAPSVRGGRAIPLRHGGLPKLCSLPRSSDWSEGPAARRVRPPGTGCPSVAQPVMLKVAISCPSAKLQAKGPRTTTAGLPRGHEARTQSGSRRAAASSAGGHVGCGRGWSPGGHGRRGAAAGGRRAAQVSASGQNPGESPGARLCHGAGVWGTEGCRPVSSTRHITETDGTRPTPVPCAPQDTAAP